MAQVITVRRLVTELVLKSKPAEKALAAYDRLWKRVATGAAAAAKEVASAASSIERSLDTAAAKASTRAAKAPASSRSPASSSARQAGISAAQQAGLAAGSKPITDATAALDKMASASTRTKAAIKDLEAQVARNRAEVSALRQQAILTGDAEGTLAGRMKGLSAATSQAMLQLQGARRTLRELDGGLIDAVRGIGKLRAGFGALQVAAGNMLSSGLTRFSDGAKASLVGVAKAAIDFEVGMKDIKKVLPESMDAAAVKKLEAGIKSVSTEIGVMPNQVAALTASLAQSGIVGEELLVTAEDASKLSVAFGISGEEAGQALAKMRTGLGLSREGVNNLAGSINELSNNLAATAPEIVDAVQRVGSVAKAANVSAESTAALVTSMIASGASAEVAATGTKNFLRALAAGPAATKSQRMGFAALGLDAVEMGKRIARGGKEAEAAITDVVQRIGSLREEERLPAMIKLFGSESIGAIGPLATNVKLLGDAFAIAGNEAKTAGSVEKEYAAASKTTAAAIDKLKANIGVLAIELGNALLPYINKVVEFLTSPEGKEWGKNAVAKTVEVITGLGSALQKVIGFLGTIIEKFGGVETGIAAVGVAVLGLLGPFGKVAAAGAAIGAAVAKGLTEATQRNWEFKLKVQQLESEEVEKEIAAVQAEADATRDEMAERGERGQRAQKALELWKKKYFAEKKVEGFGGLSMEDRKRFAEMEYRTKNALVEGATGMHGTFDERIAAFERAFQEPAAAVPGLAPPKPRGKGGGGGGHRGHKATKMDKQLGELSPALRDVLVRGGEDDEGGDLKVHEDELSRSAFNAALKHKGLGGVGGVGAVGPGPNITNVYNNTTITVQQAIDARSTGSVPENIRAAATDAGRQTGEAAVKFIGASRVLALRQSGGALTGA